LSLAEEEKAKQATQPPVREGDIERPEADPAQLDEEEQVRLALALSLVENKQSSGSDSGNTSKSGSPQNQPVHNKKGGKGGKGKKGNFRPIQGNAADNGKPLNEDELVALAIAESLKDQPVAQEFVRDPRPGRLGFHNMGATCYLATAVQLLGHLRVVRERLLTPNAVLTNPNPIASAFLSTLRHMWERAEETGGEPIEPVELVAALREAAGPGKFLPHIMEDSHEALWYILNSLSEATSPREGARTPSVIDHIFGTVFKNSKTCSLCSHASPVMEPLLEVLVPIPKTLPEGIEAITLEETFRARQEEEDVEDYACNTCDGYTPARGKTELIASGEVVVFVMKRFTREGIKIDTPVEFPMVIDFLPTGVYDLVGVGHHRGATVKSGHYTAEFFHDVHNEWVDGNDRAVVSKEGSPATVSRTAYILVYQRRTA
jgi:ubiquitin C-terminal hydrolase